MRQRSRAVGKSAKRRGHQASGKKLSEELSRRASTSDLQQQLDHRTRELNEALAQQAATSEVLSIIRRSPANPQPVFDAIVQSAARLCDAIFSVLYLCEADRIRIAATENYSPEAKNISKLQQLSRPDRSSLGGRAILDRAIAHVPDVLADPEYSRELALAGGWRAVLAVPLLRDAEAVGSLNVGKTEPTLFSDRQVQLLKTFAEQALIAIENVRLFNEVQARTRDLSESLQQQTATADVLKVISRSAFDLWTVLQTLIESAARFCDADKATILREKNGAFYRTEVYGFSREFVNFIKDIPIEAERGSAAGRALLEGQVVHIPDVKTDPEYTQVETQRLGDYRTILCVPMLREGIPIGVLILTRNEVRPFVNRQIELVQTFADQAAIAIENVRLFEAAEARSRELATSLDELRTAQDRLVQTEKLASLGQLTAGIAHEIKNPLNFVNNFSSVSADLIEELGEALADLHLEGKAQAEVSELAEMLKGNLAKIVEHGKRADSIVKNMLMHARQGSAEHRPVDINALVEESLNLAYHGARVERQGFDIILERAFDPNAGEADLYPQDITRVLLNLISNGFYATLKRKQQADADGYEPMVTATTRDLGHMVELRIRDNGTGIPPAIRDKLFNPFFTTKPAGEGTGLGLSISHDIVVKRHGGTLEVDSEPGAFTEFTITLPRAIERFA